MENKKNIYIVSFGDSEQYRLPAADLTSSGNANEEMLVKLEKELNSYLRQRFPEDVFAYYTTPKVTEISAEHAPQYASYPVLDKAAVDEIKRVLEREVKVMRAEKQLDDNAPWSNIN